MKVLRELRFLLPTALVVASCSSILGIEDVHPDAKPGSGDGGDTGSGGTSGGKGGTSGASGSAGKGGASGASGSAGKGGTSGEAGGGGAGDTGTGGTGGAGDSTVRGRIVTTWLQPIPNVTVMIGDQEADTNSNGEFEIADVTAEYDAKFVINYDVNGAQRTYGWAYLGLTRRDPTLAVYNGLTYRGADVTIQPNGITATTPKLGVAVGGDDVMYSWEASSLTGPTNSSAYWHGPATTNVTAHALLWETNVDGLPTTYHGYDETLAVLSENTATTLSFSFDDQAATSTTIGGTVQSTTTSERTNYVFLRFTSNASMKLVEHYGSSLNPDSFSYVVPAITGGSIEIAAVEGDWYRGPSAIVHRDRVPPGQMDVALTIPTPPQQVAPANDTYNVDDATIFSWTSSAGNFVWNAENIEPTSPVGGMYIVTADKRLTIPSFTNGFTLLPGDLYNWRVETHGNATSVDELAGPEGFADSYAQSAYGPERPKRGDGTYGISAGRVFTTAP